PYSGVCSRLPTPPGPRPSSISWSRRASPRPASRRPPSREAERLLPLPAALHAVGCIVEHRLDRLDPALLDAEGLGDLPGEGGLDAAGREGPVRQREVVHVAGVVEEAEG